MAGVVAAPNLSLGGEPIIFKVSLTESASIQLNLYTVAGELAYETRLLGKQGMNQIPWNLVNASGSQVASGLYLYVLQVTGPAGIWTRTGKVMVMH